MHFGLGLENVLALLSQNKYLESIVERLGGFPGGGRGMKCAVMVSALVVGVTGRGILLFRKSGLEEEDSDGGSSPLRSEREPRSDSSS